VPAVVAVVPPVPGQPEPEAASPGNDLRSRVSSMAQAIGSFGAQGPEDGLAVPRPDAGAAAAGQSQSSLAVVSMVDVMKQFDANGHPVASQGPAAALAKPGGNVPGIHDPAHNGFLVSGGPK
jgi:hypothetical protein